MRLIPTLFLLLLSSCALADAPAADTDAAQPRIGLVLGGGGARGAAHIGVLQVLERERIPVHAMAGTSMGAIVGGLYATGYRPDEIEAILAGIDWADALRDDPPRVVQPMRRKEDDLRLLLDTRIGFGGGRVLFPQGLIQGQRLLQLLRRLMLPAWDVEDFDRLAIPFRCIGTDIGRGEGVVFDRGDLALAVRASMSVPGAFAPIRVDGRLMVDGGLVDNVPADVVRAMGAERLIVVDVGAPLADEEALGSPFAISMQMIDMLMRRRTDQVLASLHPDDIVLRPPLGDLGSAAFTRAVEGIEAGRIAAEAALPALRRYALDEAAWRAHLAARPKLAFDPTLVAFLEVIERETGSAGFVENRLADLAGQPLDPAAVDAAVNAIYGTGGFESMDWRLRRRGDEVGIEVAPVDKRWGPNFLRFGLRLSDDFQGRNTYQMVFESTSTGLNRAGAEWRNTLSLGEYAGLRSEWYQPTGELSEFFVQPYADYRAYELPIRVDQQVVADFRLTRMRLGVEGGWNLSPIERIVVGVVRGYSDIDQRVGSVGLDTRLDGAFGAVSAGYARDTLDSALFPTAGTRFDAGALLFRDALGSDEDGEILRLSFDRAWSAGKHRWLLGARGQASWGEPDAVAGLAELGGFLNVSGYGERELLGLNSLLLRGVYYRRLGAEGALFSLPAYVGGSLEAGNVWFERRDMAFGDLRAAGSIFVGVESPLGPVFVGYGRSEGGIDQFYLHFGSLLRPAQP